MENITKLISYIFMIKYFAPKLSEHQCSSPAHLFHETSYIVLQKYDISSTVFCGS